MTEIYPNILVTKINMFTSPIKRQALNNFFKHYFYPLHKNTLKTDYVELLNSYISQDYPIANGYHTFNIRKNRI